jgi:hypothetical protein
MAEKKIIQRWNELPFLYRVQIWAYLLCGICSAICYPLTTKLIYSSVETETLASRLVLSSVIGIVLSLLWLNIQEKLYKYFIHFTMLECIAYTSLIIYVILYRNFDSYLIISTIIGGTIGHIVNGADSKLHQQITDNEQYRTDYGFFIEIVASIGVLVGSAIAVMFNITVTFAFLLALVNLIGFQLTDIYVYLRVK